ncbi:ectoine synthase [Chitinolyticbacter meiyuanensis]|uniref:ectoine synthase n=1 Tax=Chitinolyticbacter meiyuanensis TaxID=682798 RepID=UPI0011E5FFAD|nr:ectoine synthase [Chitinolyticbacter meiyuanensis]
MIVRHLNQIIDTDRDVVAKTWASRRLLLAEDGMGFSMHETLIFAGTETSIWYQHHLEAVYCIEGEGEIELVPSRVKHRIEPGMLYALNQHDKHLLRATTQLRLVCVFNPPLTGREVHDEDGTYPLPLVDPA